MDNKQINLEVITKQYRKKGAAAKGFRTVNSLIKDNKIVSLRILLRDHKENPIDSIREVNERDNIDFYIDYFSILEIGLIANYIPNPLPVKTEREIDFILKNEFVNKYFTEYYPLILPQLLLKQISSKRDGQYFYRSNIKNSTALFDRFLMLNQIVKNDDDIDQFLWFLDDGWTSGYSISDFWEVLSNRDIIKYKLGSSNKHPLNSALWGFIKYIQFLSDFANLLRDSKEDSLLQSAFWHHQSYWFDHMKEKIGDIIKIGISNIRQSMSYISSEEIIHDKKSFLTSSDDIEKWRTDTSQLEGVEADIKYLLDGKLGEPLKSFFYESK
ncbi:MAG: hypothetical protein KF862_01160 [Chitinophagaceae bacterium]|nr:hypothetical protein [Chitinophagaceae bacterium]